MTSEKVCFKSPPDIVFDIFPRVKEHFQRNLKNYEVYLQQLISTKYLTNLTISTIEQIK